MPADDAAVRKENTMTRSKIPDHRGALLTVSQAAKHLGVGKQIVYQLIEFGEIQAFKARGTTLVARNSLDAFRASGKLT